MNYRSLGAQIGVIVEEKNKTYGDSYNRGGDVIRVLYPNGIRPDQYDDVLAMARIVDKLFRVATRDPLQTDPAGESPWLDLAGYGLLGASRDESKRTRPRALVIGSQAEPLFQHEVEDK